MLPSREEVLSIIESKWQEVAGDAEIDSIRLHYLEEGVEIDLVVKETFEDKELGQKLMTALKQYPYIVSLQIFNKLLESKSRPTLS